MGQVDRLAQIREQQKALRAEAQQIRAQLLAGLAPVVDRHYTAEITPHITLRELAPMEPAPIARTNGVRTEWYHAD